MAALAGLYRPLHEAATSPGQRGKGREQTWYDPGSHSIDDVIASLGQEVPRGQGMHISCAGVGT